MSRHLLLRTLKCLEHCFLVSGLVIPTQSTVHAVRITCGMSVTAVCMCPMDLGTRPKLCTLSFSDYDSCDKQHKYHRPCQPRTAICSDTMDYVFTVYLILERPFSRCIPLLSGLLAAPLFLSYKIRCETLRTSPVVLLVYWIEYFNVSPIHAIKPLLLTHTHADTRTSVLAHTA